MTKFELEGRNNSSKNVSTPFAFDKFYNQLMPFKPYSIIQLTIIAIILPTPIISKLNSNTIFQFKRKELKQQSWPPPPAPPPPPFEPPPFLTLEDFRNAKFVKTDEPLKPIMNDQHFSVSIKSKRYRRGSVVSQESDKWPDGRIPYVLSSTYTTSQRAVLARAISSYNAKTCIRFVPKVADDRDYVVISKLDGFDFYFLTISLSAVVCFNCKDHLYGHVLIPAHGLRCYADFARVGGRQQVSLADECIDYATIIHEFMHVIGFIHEHQREDRDSYVKIVWKNVIEGDLNGKKAIHYTSLIAGANADFDKLSAVGLSNYGQGYDYFSIMHYESTEGSSNGKNTIEATIPEYTPLMGKSTDFTPGDLKRVNRAYKCRTYLQ